MRHSSSHRVARKLALILLSLIGLSMALQAQDRVPRPEFESDYRYPILNTPEPRAKLLEYLDVGALVLSIGVATFFALKKRSRTGLFIMSLFSIAYFGFFRKGCVCPVGSIQNIAHALFNPGYAIPVAVILFFAIPLISTLAYGRTFCSSVCPLGALQDLFTYRQLKLPDWLRKPLSFFPTLYLGFAILLAATEAEFVICRFDPFISIFRLGGPFHMLILGGAFLILGMFISRPYCRFFCPYGVLLRWVSRISWRHATITPDTCIKCGLCGNACPVEAIQVPNDEVDRVITEASLNLARQRIKLILLLSPLILAGGVYLGSLVAVPLSRIHPDVALAVQLEREDRGIATSTLESDTFRSSRTTRAELAGSAGEVTRRFRRGSLLLGGFIATMLCIGLLYSFQYRRRTDYEIDRGHCVSCGRCFSYCPKEHQRRKTERLGLTR